MLYRSQGVAYQDALAQIVRHRRVKKYLEIGVQAGVNISNVEVDEAIGIDPAFNFTVDPTKGKRSLSLYRMTSDEFFAEHSVSDLDFAFLDGMHRVEFLLRDFMNTEESSKNSGMIVMHDCLPFDACMVPRDDNGAAWTGDVWKIVPILRLHRPDLRISLLDASPTGLVCVTSLGGDKRTLRNGYDKIVDTAISEPNDQAALELFYSENLVLSTAKFLEEQQEL